MNNGISISTLLVVGLLVYLLFRSQNANATNSTGTGTASNSNSEDNSDNNTGNKNSASAYGLQQDPMEDSAKKTGERIGNHKWPSTNSELADAKAGWKEAILIWKEYANANDTQKKKKYKKGKSPDCELKKRKTTVYYNGKW